MKFYIFPTISISKNYYSFYTSFGFLLLYLYLTFYQKGPPLLQNVILLVAIFSMIHHVRSFEDDYHDFFRYMDILLATCLSVLILFYYFNQVTIFFGILLVSLFFYIQIKCKSFPKKQSILHACLHLLVISLLIYNVNYTNENYTNENYTNENYTN